MSQVTPAPTVGEETCSSKSYATAVVLAAVVGWLGIHLFYLGRGLEAFVDVGLSAAWITFLILGDMPLMILFLILDFGHAFIVTILLLTGNFRDGEGCRVCYPGQELSS